MTMYYYIADNKRLLFFFFLHHFSFLLLYVTFSPGLALVAGIREIAETLGILGIFG